jgi:putative sterol carrier protein
MAEYQTKEQLYAVLDQVVAELQQDDAFLARIANANASLAFTVTDLENAEYVLSFSKGAFSSAKEGAAQASVGVTLKSDTLDKLLSGKLSGESAYFSGMLRLRGDEWMAQSLASYLGYMGPLYRQATNV